ncbi:MAG: CHAD domain-containing protein [Gemmatimonadaceae bacterium]|nr:CHAD domain-containing protein [Gemmatimonadaceae bacterium]
MHVTPLVDVAVRNAVLAQLDRAEAAWPRWAGGDDDGEAVHDVRVAVRRARALLREGEGLLTHRPPKPLRRALRALARGSGALRDLDVALPHVVQAIDTAEGAAREAGLALLAAWRDRRAAHHAALVTTLGTAVPRWREGRARFALVHLSLDTPGSAVVEAGQAWVAKRWRGAADAIAMVSPRDADALHALRIRLKQVRALVVTLDDELRQRAPAIEALATLATEWQDRLGAMRDAMVRASLAVATRDALDPRHAAEVTSLATRWRAEADAAQAAARFEWQRTGRAALRDALRAAADALVQPTAPVVPPPRRRRRRAPHLH